MIPAKKKLNGFSLIEVLLAIVLVTAGMLSAIQLVSVGLVTASDSRNELTANLLAQEGIELVRNIRDNNFSANPQRDGFAGFPATNSNNCRIDIMGELDCSGGSNTLNIDVAGFFSYVTVGTIQTSFSRQISIIYDVTPSTSAKTATVTSMVTWGNSQFQTAANCTVAKKCIYDQMTFTKWGSL